MTIQPTHTPWLRGQTATHLIIEDSNGIEREYSKSYVVRAVNSHAELLEALEAMRDVMISGPARILRDDEVEVLIKSRNAIAKAEGDK